MAQIKGRVSQVIGPVVDVAFQAEAGENVSLPAINEALIVKRPDGPI